jgi:hypothetical protein
MKSEIKTEEELLLHVEDLAIRLDEAEETLRAIRKGEVDAVVVSGPEGEQVYTLKGASQPYRIFVESMNENKELQKTFGFRCFIPRSPGAGSSSRRNPGTCSILRDDMLCGGNRTAKTA